MSPSILYLLQSTYSWANIIDDLTSVAASSDNTSNTWLAHCFDPLVKHWNKLLNSLVHLLSSYWSKQDNTLQRPVRRTLLSAESSDLFSFDLYPSSIPSAPVRLMSIPLFQVLQFPDTPEARRVAEQYEIQSARRAAVHRTICIPRPDRGSDRRFQFTWSESERPVNSAHSGGCSGSNRQILPTSSQTLQSRSNSWTSTIPTCQHPPTLLWLFSLYSPVRVSWLSTPVLTWSTL